MTARIAKIRCAGRVSTIGYLFVCAVLSIARVSASESGTSHSSRPDYCPRKIEGWTVQVNSLMLERESETTESALKLLRSQLREIVRVVPPDAVAKLREVTLWFTPGYEDVKPTAEYHPDRKWLVEHHRDAAMAKGIEFSNIRIFAAETRRMPVFVLHELAHAYHDRVFGFDNAEIKAAFDRAKASKLYDSVERRHGDGRPNTTERAYAMSNPMEYFAESTEAFFGRNDFYPFTREELHRHDPEIEKLLERVWSERSAGKPLRPSAGAHPAESAKSPHRQ